MKELTFKEVIANIKEGEVWENPKNRIKRIFINEIGNIHLEGNETFSINYSTCVKSDSLYTLQRKEYTFEEAFKAYEEGKEIESCAGMRYKKINSVDKYFSTHSNEWVKAHNDILFNMIEIRNEWYIND